MPTYDYHPQRLVKPVQRPFVFFFSGVLIRPSHEKWSVAVASFGLL